MKLPDSLAQNLAPLQKRLTHWWQGRAPREQQVLTLLGVIFVVFVLFSLFWQPVMHARQEAKSDYVNAKQTYQWIQSNAASVKQAHKGQGTQQAADWISQLGQSAKASGLTLKGFTPNGDSQVRVSLQSQPFAAVMGWLGKLHRDAGVLPIRIDINAADKPGRVNVNVTLGSGT